MKDGKVTSLNIKYFVLLQYSIEYKSQRNYKTFISLYIYVLHRIFWTCTSRSACVISFGTTDLDCNMATHSFLL